MAALKVLVIGKNGGLVRPPKGRKWINSPEDQQPIPGIYEQLTNFKNEGYYVVATSNEGGVAAGYKSVPQANAEMKYCLELFPQLSSIFYCPDFGGRECLQVTRTDERLVVSPIPNAPQSYEVSIPIEKDEAKLIIGHCRKPKAGMLRLIRGWYKVKLHNSKRLEAPELTVVSGLTLEELGLTCRDSVSYNGQSGLTEYAFPQGREKFMYEDEPAAAILGAKFLSLSEFLLEKPSTTVPKTPELLFGML
jgi:histidinol phosphatase-like enzyme